MIFDTHTHLTFPQFSSIDEEISKMKNFGVNYAALIGTDINEAKKTLKIVDKYDCFYAVIWWLHPGDIKTKKDLENLESILEELLKNKTKIVWIGEVGFDYFSLKDEDSEIKKKLQKELFDIHIKIAKKYNLPLIIHSRNARSDSLKFIKESWIKKFVVHCFSEDLSFANEIMEYSSEAYFWFTGIVTYKNTDNIKNTVSKIPLNRILVETDAPFLAPQEVRWQVNTSAYTKYVLDKVKELRIENSDIVEKQIFENSLKFFGITNI